MQVKIDPVVSSAPQAVSAPQPGEVAVPSSVSAGKSANEAGVEIEVPDTLRFEIQLLQEKRAVVRAGFERAGALTADLETLSNGLRRFEATFLDAAGAVPGSQGARDAFAELVEIFAAVERVTPTLPPDAILERAIADETFELPVGAAGVSGFPVSRRDWVEGPSGPVLTDFVELPLDAILDPTEDAWRLGSAINEFGRLLSLDGEQSGITASGTEIEAWQARGLAFGANRGAETAGRLAAVFEQVEARLAFRLESLTTQIAENRAALDVIDGEGEAASVAGGTAAALLADPDTARRVQSGVDAARAAVLLRGAPAIPVAPPRPATPEEAALSALDRAKEQATFDQTALAEYVQSGRKLEILLDEIRHLAEQGAQPGLSAEARADLLAIYESRLDELVGYGSGLSFSTSSLFQAASRAVAPETLSSLVDLRSIFDQTVEVARSAAGDSDPSGAGFARVAADLRQPEGSLDRLFFEVMGRIEARAEARAAALDAEAEAVRAAKEEEAARAGNETAAATRLTRDQIDEIAERARAHQVRTGGLGLFNV